MKLWRDILEKILLGSKYIWTPLPTELNLEEFNGVDDQMGFVDHVTDFISDVEKKAYMAGFAGGVSEVLKETEELDIVTNQITAERRYLEWSK